MASPSHSYKMVLLRMVDDGVIEPGVVAEVASRYGYADIVRDMMDRGARNYDMIARIGAQYGHRDIVSNIIQRVGTNLDYDYIAGGAIRGGYPLLAKEIDHQKNISQYTYNRYTSPTPNEYPY